MRRVLPPSAIAPGHPDFELIAFLEHELLKRCGGQDDLASFYPAMLRDEIDRLIDTANTSRRRFEELDKVEKTYMGTRVEIRLRKFFGLPRGKLDLRVEHVDVDIKHTMGSGWMIPGEAVGKPCLLSAADEVRSLCFLGLAVCRPEYLSTSANRDRKRQIASAAWSNIRWLILEHPYPPNFWRTLTAEVVEHIFEPRGGTERLCRLFRSVRDKVISRRTVLDAAQQLDGLKRVRGNGGARDTLSREGILVLSGNYNARLINALGLPHCAKGDFVSHKISGPAEAALARKAGIKGF